MIEVLETNLADPGRRALIAAGTFSAVFAPLAARASTARGGASPQEASDALDRAIVARDRKAIERILADDFLWVRGSGVRTGREAFLDGLAASGVVIEPFRPSDGRWLVSGNMAVFSAVNELRGTEDGAPFVDKHSFCDVWRLRRGRWRLVYTQITRMPEVREVARPRDPRVSPSIS